MTEEARNRYIRRTNELVENCTIADLAEIFDLNTEEVLEILKEDPRNEYRRRR